jgi:hypothetical protein
MKLVEANPTPNMVGLDELPGKSHWFVGNDPHQWRANIPNYARVEYQAVYPGIDLVYYGNQQQLEYDFIVAAGADPDVITLGFQGVDQLEINAQGDLILHTAGGKIGQHRPCVYQEINGVKEEILGGYVLKGEHQVGFEAAAYDTAQPLVIDPVLVYSTYLGGSPGNFSSGFDRGNSIAADAAGNAYVTGRTVSIDFPIESAQPTFADDVLGDVFVAKLNAAGNMLLYSTHLGGNDIDEGFGIAVDAEGNAYVTGSTFSTNFPTVGAIQARKRGCGACADAFVAKLGADGSALIYSTYLGGSRAQGGNGIAVDVDGNAYVIGATTSTDFPTAIPFQNAKRGFLDAFVTKLDPTGSALAYSTYLGGDSDEIGYGIAVDAVGDAYVTGVTVSTNFPTVRPFQSTNRGFIEAFVTKLKSTGDTLVYSTYLGGSGISEAYGIAVDAAGHAYVTGTTESPDFPTAHPWQPVFGGDADAFVTKLSPEGNELVYSTYLGGRGGDKGHSIAVNADGNAYVTGRTGSNQFPMTSALQANYGGNFDAFVTKLHPAGADLIYFTYLGGHGEEQGYGIALDGVGNVYVTGMTNSTDFIMAHPFQSAYRGGQDAFVSKIVDTVATNKQKPNAP